MNFKQYEYINKTISSEMFYSLMAILHEKLPISTTFFRLKKQFRDRKGENGVCSSPVRTIASPKLIRGLSITKANRNISPDKNSQTSSPEIRIKNLKNSEAFRR